jgi:predicted methyltransferase
MYNGEPNQGMRCIIDIINRFNHLVEFKVFDVRRHCELPEVKKYDIYIFTGARNPLEGDGNWINTMLLSMRCHNGTRKTR